MAKFSGTDGSHQWSQHFGDTMYDRALGVAVDADGDVAVSGYYSVGVQEAFMAKYAGDNGDLQWSQRFRSSEIAVANDVSLNDSGDLVVTGYFTGTIDFGGGELVSAGYQDIFVTKHTGWDGTHQWSRRFGGDYSDVGSGVAAEAGDVMVTGAFQDMTDFGDGSVASAGNYDVMVLNLEP